MESTFDLLSSLSNSQIKTVIAGSLLAQMAILTKTVVALKVKIKEAF